MKNRNIKILLFLSCLLIANLACGNIPNNSQDSEENTIPVEVVESIDRESVIPTNAIKSLPETDMQPPISYSEDYQFPVPIAGGVNTAGAEDSPFISPDGNTLYFFFTPDVKVPIEKQILDRVTGIYMSEKIDGEWAKAKRILLQDPGKLAGDGCEFVQNKKMWFCSAREGYTGMHWFTAEFIDGSWQNWTLADFDPKYEVGEFHISSDGSELYFGSERAGGAGGLDIWVSNNLDGEWQEPINISAINTETDEGWPALNPAGDELWFSRNFGIWRSKRIDGEWQKSELIISPLAGEPTIDQDGNLYFVHHYFKDNEMIEADIYIAIKNN